MTTEFIKHDGGECPVADGTLIDIKHKNGIISYGVIVDNSYRESNYYYVLKLNGDIIGWRLAEQPKQDNEPVADEEFSLLHILADIRTALGVGDKPMLTELAPLVQSIKQQNNLRKATISKLEADNAELIEALVSSNNLLNSIIHEAQDTANFIESFNPLIKRIKGE